VGALLGAVIGEVIGFALAETLGLKEGSRYGLPVGAKIAGTKLEDGTLLVEVLGIPLGNSFGEVIGFAFGETLGRKEGDRDVVGVEVGGNSSSSSAVSTLEIPLSSCFSTTSLNKSKNSSWYTPRSSVSSSHAHLPDSPSNNLAPR
jgi:hypothetical protein